ncbi:autophagy protein Apg9-domain-containing protein [Phlyctochytrium arcticum]|nr:autophagy protein Apg9-domain-containing protein [Phlyctochytrium arcticum]
MDGISASIAELTSLDTKERSLKMWVETGNLDKLLKQIYSFYAGKGFFSIILARITNLFVLAFIVSFSTFLFQCIDYSLVGTSKRLSEVTRPYCLRNTHGLALAILIVFSVWWTSQLLRLVFDIPQLLRIYRFYYHALGIKDVDMQTLDWSDVVVKITQIPEIAGPLQSRAANMKLDAHNIANRILRKDNYMIALFNKDILDLTVPYLGRRQMLTKIMEWNLSFCVFSYIFNEEGRVRKRFIKDTHRTQLINGLKRRFLMMGILNLICAPFIFFLWTMDFFFRYAEEFHQNPSSLGSRHYSPFARWKFREFNELPHQFEKRLNRSHRLASKYMNQFPNPKMTIIARFVAFLAGAFLAVLVILTMVEEELLHGFEITPGRSAFFYIGIFGTVLAVSRGMVPDENEVFDPARLLRLVIEQTHYLPQEWRDKLHTEATRQQFSVLFEYKIILFLQEILSVLFAPLILCYSLPSCADHIIDFFREFTVHVESVGYVCSFAVFDFKRHGNLKYGAPAQGTDEYYVSKGGKMEQSFLNFKMNNPEWEPRGDGSIYLNTVVSRGHELAQSQFMQGGGNGVDPGNSSSLLLHSLLRPKHAPRNGRFGNTHTSGPATSPERGGGGGQPGPSFGQYAQTPAGPPTSPNPTQPHQLHPLHSVQPHPFLRAPPGQSMYRQSNHHVTSQSSMGDSMVGMSDLELEGRGEAGRTLFALLDAIYESNKTLY